MHSAQGEEDYCGAANRISAHSETLGQVARKFPYDYSYDTYVLNNDKSNVVAKLLPHPPVKGKKNLLRRTQSNPEGASMSHGKGLHMNHLPALKNKKTSLGMGNLKEEDQTHGMTSNGRGNELSALTKTQRIPETVPDSIENPAVDRTNTHKKLERSKTTPVSFLEPVLKTSPLDLRRRVQASTMSQRGYADDQHHGSPRTHSTTSNSSRNTSLKDGSGVYCASDIEPHGIFKDLEKTYVFSEPRISTMTKALPNGRRFGTARIDDKYKGELNTVPSTSLSSPKQQKSGIKEKTVYTQRKFTRTGQLTGLQFIDDSDQADVQPGFESTQEKNPEQSQDLTYLRFTKERQEDNRI